MGIKGFFTILGMQLIKFILCWVGSFKLVLRWIARKLWRILGVNRHRIRIRIRISCWGWSILLRIAVMCSWREGISGILFGRRKLGTAISVFSMWICAMGRRLGSLKLGIRLKSEFRRWFVWVRMLRFLRLKWALFWILWIICKFMRIWRVETRCRSKFWLIWFWANNNNIWMKRMMILRNLARI